MAMIDLKSDPTKRDVAAFAALWAIFFPVLGWIAAVAGDRLLILAGVDAGCSALWMLLGREQPWRRRLVGAAFPVALAGIWAGARVLRGTGLSGGTMVVVLVALGAVVGLAGCIVALASRPAGTRLYRAWMLGALPIGWTLMHVLLGAVFCLVVTPIGLIMRALGHDPMQRRRDPAAASYWIPRRQERDARRYLRQS